MVGVGGSTAFGGARGIDRAIPPQGRRLMDEFRAAMPPARPIDDLIAGTLVGDDPALAGALTANKAPGLVPHDVAPTQPKLLEFLLRAAGATRVLEIATLPA